MLLTNLSRDADNTASRTGSSVASLEGLLVVTLAEIVGAGVDNNGAANDAVGANQLDKRVGDGTLGVTLSIGLDVTQVTNVTGLIRRRAVSLVEGVEVRTGRGAAVGVVTKGVDVEATLCVGVVAGDVVGDGGRGTLRGLLEDDGAGDLGVSSEDSDGFDHFGGGVYNCFVQRRATDDDDEEVERTEFWRGTDQRKGSFWLLRSYEIKLVSEWGSAPSPRYSLGISLSGT